MRKLLAALALFIASPALATDPPNNLPANSFLASPSNTTGPLAVRTMTLTDILAGAGCLNGYALYDNSGAVGCQAFPASSLSTSTAISGFPTSGYLLYVNGTSLGFEAVPASTLIGASTPISGICLNGYVLYNNSGTLACEAAGGTGTVTSSGTPTSGQIATFTTSTNIVGNTNVSVPGTLGVTGNTTLSGTLGVTGNSSLSGTLGVTGLSTLTGGATIPSIVKITGGSPSVLNLCSSPPTDGDFFSSASPALDVCPTVSSGLPVYASQYNKTTSAQNATIPEYFFVLDNVFNSGTSPLWTATTSYVSGNYVVNGTNLYQEITATCTSAGSGGPTGTGSNIADNTCHWNYMNPSYYAQKTGFFNSCTTGSASPNASWCSAEDYVVGPSDTGWFHINKELDMTNSTGRAPSSTNILNTLSLSGNIGAYPITADINFFHPANGSSFAALNGLMFAGGFMYQNSTIADATTNGVLGIDLSSAAYSSALAMKIGNTYNIGWLNSSAQFTLGSHGALIGNANINETVLDNYDTGTFIFRGSGFSTVAEISPSALLFEGHVSSIGGPPIVSSCGTGPLTSVDFNDTHGTITEGTTATGCTITFKDVHNNAPDCVISFQTQLPAALTYSTSTTALTVSNTSATGDKFSYVCMGN